MSPLKSTYNPKHEVKQYTTSNFGQGEASTAAYLDCSRSSPLRSSHLQDTTILDSSSASRKQPATEVVNRKLDFSGHSAPTSSFDKDSIKNKIRRETVQTIVD